MLIPIILCGGAGSRLWPVSRELHPKPFMKLPDGQSLLQKAFLRGAYLPGVQEMMTVGNRDFFFKTVDEFQSAHIQNVNATYLLEPFGRNTAAAIACATLHAHLAHGDDACLLVLPADHLILDQAAFAAAVAQAQQLAANGRIVTFGIQPDRPETGYGYIESNGSTVTRFVEKPDLETAKHYISSGRYLWNSGMFCFKASTMLNQMAQLCPSILKAAQHCLSQSGNLSGGGQTQVQLDPATFTLIEEDSIDFAVMEKSNVMSVVPCTIGWSDIGSWSAVGQLTPADKDGNRIQGNAILRDTQNCYVQSKHRQLALLGVQDLIVIDTEDALLIANSERVQDVKHIYADLKVAGDEIYKVHRTTHRSWGTYTLLEKGHGFKIKRIEVKPGASLSLQTHQHRSEHWIVVSGTARVINADKEITLNTNQSTYIAAGHRHRLSNPAQDDLILIEVQSGNYLDEDDIVRIDELAGPT